ncbi:unnamed protein product [Ixodes hexagonus]
MSKLKDYVRKPERPLEQLYNRIMEEQKLAMHSAANTCSGPDAWAPLSAPGSVRGEMRRLAVRHEGGPLPLGCVGPEHKAVKFCLDVTIRTSKGDCTCMLKDGSIVKVENFAFSAVDHVCVLVGRKHEKLEELYTYPCTSSPLNIFWVCSYLAY